MRRSGDGVNTGCLMRAQLPFFQCPSQGTGDAVTMMRKYRCR